MKLGLAPVRRARATLQRCLAATALVFAMVAALLWSLS